MQASVRSTTSSVASPSAASTRPWLRVLLLNKEHLDITLEPKGRVEDVFRQVRDHLGLRESEYFGLAQLLDGEYRFLDLDQKVHKINPKAWKAHNHNAESRSQPFITLYFRVQFYVDHVMLLRERVTRHLYYLQLRDNLLNYSQLVPEEQCFLLVSYALQADQGNYNAQRHAHNYFDPREYFPAWVLQRHGCMYLEHSMPSMHRDLAGMTKMEAQLKFINDVSTPPAVHNLIFYKLKKRKTDPEANTWLAVCPRGVEIYEEVDTFKSQLSCYQWANITKLRYDKSKFMITVTPDGHKMTFYTVGSDMSKYLLSQCISTHEFQRSLLPKLKEIRHLEAEDRKRYKESYIYSDSRDLALEHQTSKALQLSFRIPKSIKSPATRSVLDPRFSVISSSSSNTTSGIVSDRPHFSFDESEDERSAEIMIDSPPNKMVSSFRGQQIQSTPNTTLSHSPQGFPTLGLSPVVLTETQKELIRRASQQSSDSRSTSGHSQRSCRSIRSTKEAALTAPLTGPVPADTQIQRVTLAPTMMVSSTPLPPRAGGVQGHATGLLLDSTPTTVPAPHTALHHQATRPEVTPLHHQVARPEVTPLHHQAARPEVAAYHGMKYPPPSTAVPVPGQQQVATARPLNARPGASARVPLVAAQQCTPVTQPVMAHSLPASPAYVRSHEASLPPVAQTTPYLATQGRGAEVQQCLPVTLPVAGHPVSTTYTASTPRPVVPEPQSALQPTATVTYMLAHPGETQVSSSLAGPPMVPLMTPPEYSHAHAVSAGLYTALAHTTTDTQYLPEHINAPALRVLPPTPSSTQSATLQGTPITHYTPSLPQYTPPSPRSHHLHPHQGYHPRTPDLDQLRRASTNTAPPHPYMSDHMAIQSLPSYNQPLSSHELRGDQSGAYSQSLPSPHGGLLSDYERLRISHLGPQVVVTHASVPTDLSQAYNYTIPVSAAPTQQAYHNAAADTSHRLSFHNNQQSPAPSYRAASAQNTVPPALFSGPTQVPAYISTGGQNQQIPAYISSGGQSQQVATYLPSSGQTPSYVSSGPTLSQQEIEANAFLADLDRIRSMNTSKASALRVGSPLERFKSLSALNDPTHVDMLQESAGLQDTQLRARANTSSSTDGHPFGRSLKFGSCPVHDIGTDVQREIQGLSNKNQSLPLLSALCNDSSLRECTCYKTMDTGTLRTAASSDTLTSNFGTMLHQPGTIVRPFSWHSGMFEATMAAFDSVEDEPPYQNLPALLPHADSNNNHSVNSANPSQRTLDNYNSLLNGQPRGGQFAYNAWHATGGHASHSNYNMIPRKISSGGHSPNSSDTLHQHANIGVA